MTLDIPDWMPGHNVLAVRLRCARDRAGHTLQEVADGAGIHLQQLYRYEAGKSLPNAGTLRRLAIALDVSADWLLNLPERHRSPG